MFLNVKHKREAVICVVLQSSVVAFSSHTQSKEVISSSLIVYILVSARILK